MQKMKIVCELMVVAIAIFAITIADDNVFVLNLPSVKSVDSYINSLKYENASLLVLPTNITNETISFKNDEVNVTALEPNDDQPANFVDNDDDNNDTELTQVLSSMYNDHYYNTNEYEKVLNHVME